jgi:quinoprotein glucose dehydrogenase
VQFGVEGGVYVLDWVQGWDKTGKGRIFRVHDPKIDASPIVQQTKKLLAEGMTQRSLPDLLQLLGHADQRVRLAAQFALAARNAVPELAVAANRDQRLLASIHAVWALGQIEARTPAATKGQLVALLKHPVAEVRAQAAKVLPARDEAAAQALTTLLRDPEPRVQFFAAQSLVRTRKLVSSAGFQLLHENADPGAYVGQAAVFRTRKLVDSAALFQLLKENADRDAYVRHAAVLALAAGASAADLVAKANDPSDSVRAGALLALRRQSSPEVAAFLTDRTPQLALEAARAIHDGSIPAAWPQLAALAATPQLAEPLSRRALNANYLLGDAEAAQRLAAVATDNRVAASRRIEALRSLAIWSEPFKTDRVTGLWRELPPTRDAQAAMKAVTRIAPALLQENDEAVRLAGIEAIGALKVTSAEPALLDLVRDGKAKGTLRAAALRALNTAGSTRLSEAVAVALADSDSALLSAARNLAGKASPANAVKVNAEILGKGSLREQQLALANIGAQAVPEADAVLAAQLDLLLAGKLPPALALDLLAASASRTDAAVKDRLARFNASRPAADPLSAWQECLEGGDAAAGRTIFAEKAEAGCLRCHKVKGEGGDVGPDLAAANAKRTRDHLLRSIVDPNAEIAPGYGSVLLTLNDGNLVAGLVNAEDATEITLASVADGKKQKIKKSEIKERSSMPSVMPPGLGEVLGKRGLRDVVEYLATLK